MKMIVRLAGLALAVFLGVWLWMLLFPPPQKIIRAHLLAVARYASFAPNEGAIARLARISKLTDYFTPDVRVYLDLEVPEMGLLSLDGRDEINQAALLAGNKISSVAVKFVDANVTLGAHRETATVDVTARVAARGDDNFFVGELQFFLKKIKGEWMITRVESVKVLR